MEIQQSLLSVRHIYKSFGITKALVDVCFDLMPGEILGLVGENGSGKSTISSIIHGIQSPDQGEMVFEGRPYRPETAVEAKERGICMLLQENGTFESLTVAKNIFIGCEHTFAKNGLIDNKSMNLEAEKALHAIGINHIQPSTRLSELSFEDRKLVELARAIWSRPKILIVDETTTALSRSGRDILYGLIDNMKEEGKSIIFISHDIDELMMKCDRLVILRDGHYITGLSKEAFDPEVIKSHMIGRKPADHYFRTDTVSCKNGETVLRFEKVSTPSLHDICFDLHKGEILGIGGLTDCGMHEIGRLAYGLQKPVSGRVSTGNGESVRNPCTAMRCGIVYMSKNRDQESLMIAASISDNISLPSYSRLKKGPFIWPAKEKQFVNDLCRQFDVKMQNRNQFVMELSGGNKQKVVIAKWLGFGADVLILDCPTRGIDIGVKANIYQLMSELKAKGKSMILISEELSELIGMSDRILIMKEGNIHHEMTREMEPTERELINYMV